MKFLLSISTAILMSIAMLTSPALGSKKGNTGEEEFGEKDGAPTVQYLPKAYGGKDGVVFFEKEELFAKLYSAGPSDKIEKGQLSKLAKEEVDTKAMLEDASSWAGHDSWNYGLEVHRRFRTMAGHIVNSQSEELKKYASLARQKLEAKRKDFDRVIGIAQKALENAKSNKAQVAEVKEKYSNLSDDLPELQKALESAILMKIFNGAEHEERLAILKRYTKTPEQAQTELSVLERGKKRNELLLERLVMDVTVVYEVARGNEEGLGEEWENAVKMIEGYAEFFSKFAKLRCKTLYLTGQEQIQDAWLAAYVTSYDVNTKVLIPQRWKDEFCNGLLLSPPMFKDYLTSRLFPSTTYLEQARRKLDLFKMFMQQSVQGLMQITPLKWQKDSNGPQAVIEDFLVEDEGAVHSVCFNKTTPVDNFLRLVDKYSKDFKNCAVFEAFLDQANGIWLRTELEEFLSHGTQGGGSFLLSIVRALQSDATLYNWMTAGPEQSIATTLAVVEEGKTSISASKLFEGVVYGIIVADANIEMLERYIKAHASPKMNAKGKEGSGNSPRVLSLGRASSPKKVIVKKK